MVEGSYSRNRLEISVYGRNAIMAGEVVKLKMDQFAVNPAKEDHTMSGEYVVESILSRFYEDTFVQVLTIVRGGIGK